MGFILQNQRRAIEELKIHAENLCWPDIFNDIENEFLIEEFNFVLDCGCLMADIYLRGISEGIGTCSDIKNMDVAVFGYNPSKEPIIKKQLKKCEYAVLLWPQNILPEGKTFCGSGNPVQTVELLKYKGRFTCSLPSFVKGKKREHIISLRFLQTSFCSIYIPI